VFREVKIRVFGLWCFIPDKQGDMTSMVRTADDMIPVPAANLRRCHRGVRFGDRLFATVQA
jgi:hypothetical protein